MSTKWTFVRVAYRRKIYLLLCKAFSSGSENRARLCYNENIFYESNIEEKDDAMMFKQIAAFFVCLSMFSGVSGWAGATEKEQGSSYGAWVKDISAESPEPEKVHASEVKSAAAEKTEDPYKIIINVAARSLGVYKNNEKIRLYPVGLGKLSTPTPVGYFSVLTKEENPTWVDPGDSGNTIPSGESNPLGYRWMQVWRNYGIHGTNHPESIGSYVSNGCIRMKEADVEEVYDYASVGTPVEIMYQRIVIDKIKDNMIVYYIYPDGYGYQPLDVETVAKWLAGYGVDKFESDEEIERKIELSDGQPTYVARVYNLSVNGKPMSDKALIKDDIVYLPADKIAEQLKVLVTWDSKSATLGTKYGKAIGYEKKGSLFFNAEDAGVLFHLQGGLSKRGVYELTSIKETPAASTKEEAVETKDSVESEPMRSGEETAESAKTQERRPVAARTTRIYREGQADAMDSAKK